MMVDNVENPPLWGTVLLVSIKKKVLGSVWSVNLEGEYLACGSSRSHPQSMKMFTYVLHRER